MLKAHRLLLRSEISDEIEAVSNMLFSDTRQQALTGYRRLAFSGIADAVSLLYMDNVSKETLQLKHLQDVIDSGTPLVLYDRPCPSLACDQVVSDDYTGAYNAVEYLIQTGCKRIMYFSSPMQLEIAHRRYQGWRDALQRYGLWDERTTIRTCDTREQAIIETPLVMMQDNKPDAIFCVNDHCASGVLFAAKTLGIKIPDDLSICGFANASLCRTTSPMLTTVEQHGIEIGRRAMQRLLRRLEGDQRIAQTEMVPTDLIVRETTK